METAFRLKISELNNDFIKTLQLLFGKEREVDIRVQPLKKSSYKSPETGKEYLSRLEAAKKNAEKGNVVRFTSEELESLSKKLLSR